YLLLTFFFSSRRRHTRFSRDWSSDVCSSDLQQAPPRAPFPLTLDIVQLHQQVMVSGLVHWQRDQAGLIPVATERRTILEALLKEIGRASCRERVWISKGDVEL